MRLIGTHNSHTGEKGYGVISYLVSPFVKTQNKTLVQQLLHGCTMFECTIKRTKRGCWVFSQGLWESSCSFNEAMSQLNILAAEQVLKVQVNLTIISNRKATLAQIEAFTDQIRDVYDNLYFHFKIKGLGHYCRVISNDVYDFIYHSIYRVFPIIPCISSILSGNIMATTKDHIIVDFL